MIVSWPTDFINDMELLYNLSEKEVEVLGQRFKSPRGL